MPRSLANQNRANIVCVVLAAGQSRRMGEANKLTMPVDGTPMVARVDPSAEHGGASHRRDRPRAGRDPRRFVRPRRRARAQPRLRGGHGHVGPCGRLSSRE
ncbi:MAG: hypothetical protein EP303_08275 [Deltaproteobacteria bacterium]|nr:MAG: hypothetical protein EP303_08275 [Deltaproteobacteria bacterium]